MVVARAATCRCVSLLRRCTSERHIREAHALFITSGLVRHPLSLHRLILAAAHLCPLSYASHVLLSHAPADAAFLHNALIRAHARGSDPSLAIPLFRRLLAAAAADHHSFPFALAAYSALNCAAGGFQIHAVTVKNGLSSSDHYVQTALLKLYSSSVCDVRKLFDEISSRDPVHCDVLMNAYLRADQPWDAITLLFEDLLPSGIVLDAFVVTTALTACAHAGALDRGVWIHKHIEENSPSYLSDEFVGSALVSMYAKCGCIDKAVAAFNAVPERNAYLWATLVGAFAVHGRANEALECLSRMKAEDGVRPDGVVILCVLTACAHAGLVEDGLMLLSRMDVEYGVAPEHEHYGCAVDMLVRVGRLDDAVGLVRKMPMKPLASVWGSLLAGCRIYGNVELAEIAARELQSLGAGGGDDEGVYVQLSNIYLSAQRTDDARRVRKLIGSQGIKKTPAISSIEISGRVSSFVAGDQVHPLRVEIWRILDTLMDDMVDRPLSEEEMLTCGWAESNIDCIASDSGSLV